MGDAPNVGVGSFKGVMLCSRPTLPNPATVAAQKGNSNRVAFISTIVPPEKLGLNPIKKLYPTSRTVKLPSDSVTWRHKRWLQDFQSQRAAMAEKAAVDEIEKEERKRRFAARAAKMRATIRNTVVVVESPRKAEVKAKSKSTKFKPSQDNANEKQQKTDTGKSMEKEKVKSPETGQKVSSTPKKSKKSMPAWALTEEQADEMEEDEVDNLLDFTKNLDLDQFLDDMEVREALRFVKNRVNDMERKERLYAPKQDFGSEECKEREKQERDRLPLLDERHTARSASGSKMEDRPDWNDSVRLDSMRASRQLLEADAGGGRLKHVHSSRSMAAVVERVKTDVGSATRPLGKPPARVLTTPGDALGELAMEPPTVAVNTETGPRGKMRPSGLPFLYRHPAV